MPMVQDVGGSIRNNPYAVMPGQMASQEAQHPDLYPPKGSPPQASAFTVNYGGDNTVTGRLSALLQGDSRYLQDARNRGMRNVAARGLGSSTLGAAASEEEAIRAAAPLAQSDASNGLQASMQNAQIGAGFEQARLDRENAEKLSMANQQLASAYANAGAGDSAADREFERWKVTSGRDFDREGFARDDRRFDRQFDREGAWHGEDTARDDRGFAREGAWHDSDAAREDARYARDDARYERDWNRQGDWRNQDQTREDSRFATEDQWRRDIYGRDQTWRNEDRADARSSEDRQIRYQAIGGAMGAMFSDPSYFRDPAAASGFMEFWSNNMDSLFTRFFGGGH